MLGGSPRAASPLGGSLRPLITSGGQTLSPAALSVSAVLSSQTITTGGVINLTATALVVSAHLPLEYLVSASAVVTLIRIAGESLGVSALTTESLRIGACVQESLFSASLVNESIR